MKMINKTKKKYFKLDKNNKNIIKFEKSLCQMTDQGIKIITDVSDRIRLS